MAHIIRLLKCKNGHPLGVSYDRNECGCHHNGKPCLVISCKKCFEESFKNNKIGAETIYIPLDKDGVKVVEELLE